MIIYIDNVALGTVTDIDNTSWYIFDSADTSNLALALWSNAGSTEDLLATFVPDMYAGKYGYAVVEFENGTIEEINVGVINDLTTLPRGTIENYVERPRLETTESTLTSNSGNVHVKTYPIYPSSNTLLKTVCIIYCNGNICAIGEDPSVDVSVNKAQIIPFEEGDEVVVEIAHVNTNGVMSDFTRKVIYDATFGVLPLFITKRMDPSDEIRLIFDRTLVYFNIVNMDSEMIYSSKNTVDTNIIPRNTMKYGQHYVLQGYFNVGGVNHMRTFPITTLSNNLISLEGLEFLNKRMGFYSTTDYTAYADMYLDEGDNGFTLLVDLVERQKLTIVHLDSGNVIGEYAGAIAYPVVEQKQVLFLSNSVVIFVYTTATNGTVMDIYLLKDVSGQILRNDSIQIDTISDVTTNKAGYMYYVDSGFNLVKVNGYNTDSSSTILNLTTIPGLTITNENVQIDFSDINNIIIQGSLSHVLSVDITTGEYFKLMEATYSTIKNYSFTDGVGNIISIEKSTGNITKFNPYLETSTVFPAYSPVNTIIKRRDAGVVIIDGIGSHIKY